MQGGSKTRPAVSHCLFYSTVSTNLRKSVVQYRGCDGIRRFETSRRDVADTERHVDNNRLSNWITYLPLAIRTAIWTKKLLFTAPTVWVVEVMVEVRGRNEIGVMSCAVFGPSSARRKSRTHVAERAKRPFTVGSSHRVLIRGRAKYVPDRGSLSGYATRYLEVLQDWSLAAAGERMCK